jgi:sterol desaturase/sphingolipid hydroxylase (fatty acid hydroxylase superfamily)
MLYSRLHVTFVGIVGTLVDSVIVAEFAGYWLHRLLHSDRIPVLSRGHLIHHFLIYGPRHPMRANEYHDATDDRISLGNVGTEWLAPSAIILMTCWGVMALIGVSPVYKILALCTLLAWPILMFSYLHDRMHIENFWMTRVPGLRTWFLKARRLHDIHHKSLDSNGFMVTNFGIGFYFFDRFFGTMSRRHRPFNWRGYRAAMERYGLDETELLSLQSCSKSLFQKTGRE